MRGEKRKKPLKQQDVLEAFCLGEDIEIHCHELMAEIDSIDRYLEASNLSNQDRQSLVHQRATMVNSFYKDKARLGLLAEITGVLR